MNKRLLPPFWWLGIAQHAIAKPGHTLRTHLLMVERDRGKDQDKTGAEKKFPSTENVGRTEKLKKQKKKMCVCVCKW